MKQKLSVLGTTFAILSGSSALGAPPVPFLDDNEPGIQFLFSGDPDTLESSIHDPNDPGPSLDCGRGAPRASTGGAGGKMHNDFLECDNWDFQPKEWGQASFLQGAFILGESPFSDDGGFECSGNTGPGGYNPCVNSTVRAVTTFKNQPSPGPGINDGPPMDTSKDWVFSFDFQVSIPSGDTIGNDKIFDIGGPSGDIMVLVGAGDQLGSFLNGEPDRYRLHYPFGEAAASTLIDVPLTQGRMTLHYKAANQKYDLWHNDTKLVADFAQFNNRYDANFIQLGGGGISFENALYDNIILGVLGESGPIPGDANGDGVVDVADLGVLGANFNQSNMTFADGDFNDDGIVDVADLGILGANWSASQATGNASALVPEPTTLSLLAMSVLVVGRRRR